MKFLRRTQNFIIGISIFLLIYIPLFSAFGSNSGEIRNFLYEISFVAVFLVMVVRPLSDIFTSQKWLKKLVFLRKSFGVLSASIIVGFMLGSIITPGSMYISSIFTREYWSIQDCSFFAHIGDWTGLILLVTSNNLSMILLGKNWKRIQKLAYVYFYAGGIYEACVLDSLFVLYAMIFVTIVVFVAFVMNKKRQAQS